MLLSIFDEANVNSKFATFIFSLTDLYLKKKANFLKVQFL